MPPANKKQAKAAAFRSKGKAGDKDKKKIKFEDLQPLPQTDDDAPEPSANPTKPTNDGKDNDNRPEDTEAKTNKKRKREKDDGDGSEGEKDNQERKEEGTKSSGGKSHKRRKNKQAAKANKYILFVGSLSDSVLPSDLESHFGGFCTAKPTAVRLLTQPWNKEGLAKLPARQRASVLARTEPPPPGVGGKNKGCAFVEFDNPTASQQALLKGHGTFLKGKNISVELTAGGGGSSANRQERIKTKNAKLKEERQKIHAKILESKAAGGKHTSFGEDGTASEKPAETSSDPPQGTPGVPKKPKSYKGGKPTKPKRNPASTGANAVPVSRAWGRSD